jgi:hypothetical protein
MTDSPWARFTGSGDRTDLCAMPEPNGYDGGH